MRTFTEFYSEKVESVLKKLLLGNEAIARGLYEAGMLDTRYTSSGAIGYKELLPVVTGSCTIDVAVNELKIATRHYAKRQLTWFNKKQNYHKIYVDEVDPIKASQEMLGDFNG